MVNAGRRRSVDGTGRECDAGKCEAWKREGGRKSRINVEEADSKDFRSIVDSGRNLVPGAGEVEVDVDVDVESGEGPARAPNRFFGNDARRLARLAGNVGFAGGAVGADVSFSFPL